MRVKDLIGQLLQHDQNLEVVINYDMGDYAKIESVTLEENYDEEDYDTNGNRLVSINKTTMF